VTPELKELLMQQYRIEPDSPGLRAGTILLTEIQYKSKIDSLRLAPAHATELVEMWEDMWEPVRITATSTMYHYKAAPTRYMGRRYVPGKEIEEPQDVMDEWWNEHHRLSDEFSNQLQVALTGTFLIEGDEDEEFTYGAFLQGVANLGMHADQWLLTREFGNYYSVRHIDTMLN
jgi:hypothetical protein